MPPKVKKGDEGLSRTYKGVYKVGLPQAAEVHVRA